MAFTKLTNLEVTGELKAKALNADTVSLAAAESMTAVAKAASTSYTKAEIDAIVDAVNELQVAIGRATT